MTSENEIGSGDQDWNRPDDPQGGVKFFAATEAIRPCPVCGEIYSMFPGEVCSAECDAKPGEVL